MILSLAACAHRGVVGGWGVVQRDLESFTTRIPGAAVTAGDAVIGWRWPDTRVWSATDPAPDGPAAVQQAALRPVRLEVVAVDGDTVRFRAPTELDPEATLVTRLRAEEPEPPVGARQQAYRGFALQCRQLGVEPLGGAQDAAGAACTRLPLDGEHLVATEWATGPGVTCVASAIEAPDGTRRRFRPFCRDHLGPEGPARDAALERLATVAYSAPAGPSSPEAWFRADGQVLVLLNRFEGAATVRCLSPLPSEGGRWRPAGCVGGDGRGSP